MSPPPPHQSRTRQACRVRRAQVLGIILLVLGLATLQGCSRRRDPQAVLDHAMQTLHKGDMIAASSEAERGYKDFHAVSPGWAWKFTILKARVMHLRGLDSEVIRLLTSEPAPPTAGELAVQRLRWEGLAYSSLNRFTEADEAFQGAERLCAATDYPVCADVIGAQGVLEMDRGRYVQAQGFFEKVLAAARSRGNQFWEANTMLDLSWSTERQSHFDEALDWASAARRISVSQGFADVAQAALGNVGWAYYKLGDPEKALEMFVDATKQAEKLGDKTDQIKWITNAGYIYLDAADFPLAEQAFQQSFKLAQQINSREDIINSLIALAFVSEQTSKLDDAKRYTDEGLAKARADNDAPDQVYLRLVQARVAARMHDTTTAENAFREVEQSLQVLAQW